MKSIVLSENVSKRCAQLFGVLFGAKEMQDY